MNQNKRIKILKRFKNEFGKLSTELQYNSNFEFLIASLLSIKSKDKLVNKCTKKLFFLANTPELMLSLKTQKIKKIIRNLGFFNKKTEFILSASKTILHKFSGKVPNNFEDLRSIPGVGRKIANLILNTIFDQPKIAIDTHVFRVSNRTKFSVARNVHSLEKKLLKVIPKKFIIYFHNWFVSHGKYTCTSRYPKCYKCFIYDLCEFEEKINTKNYFQINK